MSGEQREYECGIQNDDGSVQIVKISTERKFPMVSNMIYAARSATNNNSLICAWVDEALIDPNDEFIPFHASGDLIVFSKDIANPPTKDAIQKAKEAAGIKEE